MIYESRLNGETIPPSSKTKLVATATPLSVNCRAELATIINSLDYAAPNGAVVGRHQKKANIAFPEARSRNRTANKNLFKVAQLTRVHRRNGYL